eukprot:TRINITY_DN6016_c2_g1_i1.p1 TRINITY_DN6016_c2_g1~~TRINITY_DN6016_c2_g1_i1.p1  ORF type:complete len:283 (+),score=129.73 TRINITY_DN6016_c2_g1_i1:72-920(+)
MPVHDAAVDGGGDSRLHEAVSAIRERQLAMLHEECFMRAWAASPDERDLLAALTKDPSFWAEVESLGQAECDRPSAEQEIGEDEFRRMFKSFTAGGAMNVEELRDMFKGGLGTELTDSQVLDIFSVIDSDGSGSVDEDEFMSLIHSANRGVRGRRAAGPTKTARSPLEVPADAAAYTQRLKQRALRVGFSEPDGGQRQEEREQRAMWERKRKEAAELGQKLCGLDQDTVQPAPAQDLSVSLSFSPLQSARKDTFVADGSPGLDAAALPALPPVLRKGSSKGS